MSDHHDTDEYDLSPSWRMSLIGLLPGVGLAVLVGLAMIQGQPARADAGASETTPNARSAQSESKVTLETDPAGKETTRSDAERTEDSYQPKGIDLGVFLFEPKIETSEMYNSNVFATQTNVKDDVMTKINPELNLRSEFTEHELDFAIKGDQQLYKNYSHDDQTNVEADILGRYDIGRDVQMNYLGIAYSSHQDRSTPDAVQGVVPTPIQGVLNTANIKAQFDRFSFLGEIKADRLTFDDVKTSNGGLILNTDQNRWELSVRERGAYEMFPGYAAVLQVTENSHIFDKTLDRSGFDRESSGYRAEAGVAVDISKLIRGDFLLGYFQQYYKDSRLPNAEGLTSRVVFNWTPTKLTIVIPSIDRTVTDTTTAQASALDRSALTLTVRHELERNIILTGFGGVYYDQLTGVQRQNDMTYQATARLTYAFTSELYVGGEVGFQSKRSEAQLGSFDQLTTMLKLGVQY